MMRKLAVAIFSLQAVPALASPVRLRPWRANLAPASAGMPPLCGTWLEPAAAGDALSMRWLLLACIACGLIQKPLPGFAWDVRATHAALAQLKNRGASLELMGGTAIVMRQLYACKAQAVAFAAAKALHRRRQVWGEAALQGLLASLDALPRAEAGKVQGRSSGHSGPRWVREVLSADGGVRQLAMASRAVGSLFSASATAERGDDAERVVRQLLGEAKTPGVGQYAVQGIVRCCTGAVPGMGGH